MTYYPVRTHETAFKEFMNTKEHYRKAQGMFFKQNVQGFKPDCGATTDQIHQIGVELASMFEGFEVITATHISLKLLVGLQEKQLKRY